MEFDPSMIEGMPPEAMMIFVIVLIISLVVFFALAAVILFFFFRGFQGVPEEHQKMKPSLVWLGLIPVFQLYWAFVTVSKISDSYRSAFESRGDTGNGDCGTKVGFWFAMTNLLTLISLPSMFSQNALTTVLSLAGSLLSLVSFGLMIWYLVKIFDLKGKLAENAE